MKTHRNSIVRVGICFVILTMFSVAFMTGCGSSGSVNDAFLEAVNEVQSVEASISLEISGNVSGYNGSSGDQNHNGSIGSDLTIQSTLSPNPAYHVESFSRIIVDGATTREDREIYVVPEGDTYVCYNYNADTEEWERQSMSKAEGVGIPCKVGFPSDWVSFMNGMTQGSTETAPNGDEIQIYSGTVSKNILEEIFSDYVFGSFMYNVQQLIDDDINCSMRVNTATNLPEQIDLTFDQSWTISDMSFDTASVSIRYSNYNNLAEIEVPKKVSVVAADPEAEFYSTFYAWNLFLPYIGGQLDNPSGSGIGTGETFTAAWDTFQVRIDGNMANIPLPFEDLSKLGYIVNENQSSFIVEPNMYVEGIIVEKGEDSIVCTFYNDDTVPQPITSCKIGSISMNAADQKHNGIVIYLPGEVTLGISGETLVSAYGEATETVSAFASDTLTWKGENDLQWFEAEVSPVTGLMIRMEVANIPVTGGSQN